MAFQGVDVRQTGDRIVFRASLKDSAGAILATGTTNLRLYELQSDGTLKSYDWDDDTFKTTALTTENQAMTHRTGDNSTTNTGIWTFALTTLTGFTAGNMYFAQIVNTGATPAEQEREFQFGVSSIFDPFSATVDLGKILGNATGAIRLGAMFAAVEVVTIDDATFTPTTTVFETEDTSDDAQDYDKQVLFGITGQNVGVTVQVTSYAFTNSKVKLTVSQLENVPNDGDTFLKMGRIGA